MAYTGTNGETRDTDKATTSRTTAPALDPTGRRQRFLPLWGFSSSLFSFLFFFKKVTGGDGHLRPPPSCGRLTGINSFRSATLLLSL
ncbi:MAG: hypothetical protein ACE1ZP_02620 [Myxococcota bacterium]